MSSTGLPPHSHRMCGRFAKRNKSTYGSSAPFVGNAERRVNQLLGPCFPKTPLGARVKLLIDSKLAPYRQGIVQWGVREWPSFRGETKPASCHCAVNDLDDVHLGR